ncbi:DUF6133 family protein [Ethanoligenens harbinense]|uniref:Uncharacterized protein n=1 Tax=Ethanoligenens harbinense (strain DSM 18485 / JCM 12961 / CGMCC 1.5033 / YUAN-3) TaxID=663278 RepID=E6U5T2_ETHHY|nr:DUF6133 family protein [Ethanoligenens harbinense]ADU27949.1 hypothetical protein Ethha_2454 [Ethanoligenens harbinense YUAN-3]AVQ96977.1 hypothetical protein CXQ68_12605 [Ethanoligenens harbinense YUAN-3]AYF39637.1 hypothetical protein CXP51_12500 [Ethanoligenens harbinense]AYF42465.1 hypothetical protein CN246_13055 [Ethanoligenens harbinense]QCN93218.1 hypothetical protein DRA42_12650 [Ethanoligenens harbinense]
MQKIRRLQNSVRYHATKGYLHALAVRDNAKGAAFALISNDDGYIDMAMKIIIGVVCGLLIFGVLYAIVQSSGQTAQTKVSNAFNYAGS